MTQFPTIPLTPEQQRRLSVELYSRMESQVRSYHAHHGRSSTSVPAETARELMRSMVYTLEAAGGYVSGGDVSELLTRGQEILSHHLEQASELLKLVEATEPAFQTVHYGDTIVRLRRYLQRYDHVHMAHVGPEGLDYPLLVPVPEQFHGIDAALYIIRCLWMENQILNVFAPDALSELTDAGPPDYWTAPQNLCEQPLWNAMALTLLGRKPDSLLLAGGEECILLQLLWGMHREQLQQTFSNALISLCSDLGIPPQPAQYARGAIDQLIPRLRSCLPCGRISHFFW